MVAHLLSFKALWTESYESKATSDEAKGRKYNGYWRLAGSTRRRMRLRQATDDQTYLWKLPLEGR